MRQETVVATLAIERYPMVTPVPISIIVREAGTGNYLGSVDLDHFRRTAKVLQEMDDALSRVRP